MRCTCSVKLLKQPLYFVQGVHWGNSPFLGGIGSHRLDRMVVLLQDPLFNKGTHHTMFHLQEGSKGFITQCEKGKMPHVTGTTMLGTMHCSQGKLQEAFKLTGLHTGAKSTSRAFLCVY